MAQITFDTNTIERAVEAALTQHNIKPRPYLGMSQLGHNCERFLQYYFRQCYEETISAKMSRVFRTGHKAEDDMIADLEAAGVKVYGAQDEYECAYGHCKGHNDGIGIGIPEAPDKEHIIEFKTSNNDSFNKLLKEGVKKSKPLHYAQMTLYGYLKGLKHALYMVLNKNTSAYYFERINIDETYAKELIEKAERIVTQESLQPKIGGASWYECKFCSAYDICHKNAPILASCRNCKHVSVEDKGEWRCTKHEAVSVVNQKFTPCNDYKLDEWLR